MFIFTVLHPDVMLLTGCKYNFKDIFLLYSRGGGGGFFNLLQNQFTDI